MPTHVALLRGINVGGRGRVAMADLRELVASLGYEDVATYVQSGNVVLTGGSVDAAALEAAIEERLGVSSAVVVLSREELERVVADNPWPDEKDGKHLHVIFTAGEPDADVVSAAQEKASGGDEARIVERHALHAHAERVGAQQARRRAEPQGPGGRHRPQLDDRDEAPRDAQGRRRLVNSARIWRASGIRMASTRPA